MWLLYAGGIEYLLISAIVYLAGTALYVRAKRSNGQPAFRGSEYALLAVFGLGAIAGVVGVATGWIEF